MMGAHIVRRWIPALVILATLGGRMAAPALDAQASRATVTSPEQFFGFQMGTDRKMARWDRIVEYFTQLQKESPRIKIVNLGPSTQGNPFLLAIITAPANLARLDRLKEVNARLADPRGLSEADVRKLVVEGKAVICQTMSLHATEIGGTQMANELAYDLLSRRDADTLRILDNVIFLMIPSFNPDGQIVVTDWYRKTLGTAYEGTGLPWLYHVYAGHDNNRDAFQTNLVESQYLAKLMFREWPPQAYVDHHHMGSYGARIYVPPYAEPVRPLADPLVWREHSWYGAHIAYKEEEAGLSGVINMAQYSGWGHFGFHWITPFHNIAGMLTESASAKLATPLYIQPDQLRGGARGLPAYEEQTTFPNPWPGGWWRLRDIVERQKVSAWATLDLAARNKETVLWNAYLKASRQTARGAAGTPAAYVVPAAQHDPLTMTKMVNKLLLQGIEIHRTASPMSAGSVSVGSGSYVVSLAQPKMGLIRYLLGRTFYPDNEYTRDRSGAPIRPYDMATDTMFEFMGVRVEPVDQPVDGPLQNVSTDIVIAGTVEAGPAGYVLDGRLNDSFRAVNQLLAKGVAVTRVDRAVGKLSPGDFLVPPVPAGTAESVAHATGVDFRPLNAAPAQGTHGVKKPRIGLYQRYMGGNMDEGWTRLLLEQFDFPYVTLRDAEVKKGGLDACCDVIVIPDDSTAAITGERSAEGGGRGRGPDPSSVPPEYRSGIGREGTDALKAFVEKGGTLVTLGGASQFAIDRLGLPVRNVTAGIPSTDYWCPGSTLRAAFDTTHPLAYGMPSQGLVTFLGNSLAFEIGASDHSEDFARVVTFPARGLLESGWLIGEGTLANKAAAVVARVGSGKVVLIGFRTQHRAQTHGTFKVLFNALLQ
ncbi:MAG: M14 metallopeptidase family protein [Acidobacteriota bacterium]